LGENVTETKHGFEDDSSIHEPELSSQSDAVDLELQAVLPLTVESRWGHHRPGSFPRDRQAQRLRRLE